MELRDTTRALIDAQLQDLSDEEIHRLQAQLNRQYDAFRGKHGLINSRSAELSFRDDSSYYLLCSLENVDEKGNFISKSDMFTKRTIRSAQIPDHADTASDALALSIGERAKVDMPYMMHLTGKDEATLAKELAGVIFVEPFRKQEDGSSVYLMADEYLSGNVREKLRIAHVAADQDPAFRINVEALEQVQPKDLTAGEITVRLGVTWIGSEIIKRFADELFQSTYREQKIAVRYNEYLNNWYISNKSQGNDNIRVTNTYGTKRINGYHLLENALNLRATKIYDTIYDENGKEQHKLNGPATEERQYKQLMKQYDDEQAELEAKMETMKKELSEEKDSTMDIQHFISLIRKYKNPTEVSDLMFTELIDKIVVYEAEGVGKAKTQKVDIYFNYVGQVDIAYTEEELAEIKEQEEQEEKKRLEKQRQREKAYREKRKAKKLAENGGEIVKTKVCPHCGKEFTPTSNRQIFCSKDCCYQARQDKTKADREAEKGDHYYRQRVCAVCGSTYWPTHSQQKFCSEECKKVNHNKKTLEFYYKKQKEKELCKDLLQTKEQVSDTNSSEITIIPA